jgi:hypothetical protein
MADRLQALIELRERVKRLSGTAAHPSDENDMARVIYGHNEIIFAILSALIAMEGAEDDAVGGLRDAGGEG